MRRFAVVGTALTALVLLATVTVAAGPGTSPTATTAPTAEPTALAPFPSATPAPASNGNSGSTSGSAQSVNAQANLKPLNVITGSVSIQSRNDGTGLITLKTAGLGGARPWVVYVDRGMVRKLDTAADHAFVFHSGSDFTVFASEVVKIDLTKTQMTDLRKALANKGLTITVSDGVRHSVAHLAAQ